MVMELHNGGGSAWCMVDLMGNVHISPVLWGDGGVKDFRYRQQWDWRHRLDVEEWRFGFVGAIGVTAAWWCFLDGGGGRRWHGGLVSVQLRREAIKAEQGVGSGSATRHRRFLTFGAGRY
ncbi:hypothetical protein WN944_013313 [Citrus x changshan-huyou]|uniref:Uncharacterized protein n=1 Tax=Citrus x changshan-huyou TaxID=2935761 RepID=A0AAP0M8G4_9ROSI